MRFFAILAVLWLSVTAFAADDPILAVPQLEKPRAKPAEGDPLQAKYDAAWTKFEQAVSKATAEVTKALDAQFEKAADAGNLDLADMWDKKKKFFLDTKTLDWAVDGKAKVEWRKKYPTTDFPEDFSEVVATSQAAYAAAVSGLKEDYESLVKEYTKERNLGRAKQLRDESAELHRRPASAQPERPRMVEKKPEPKQAPMKDTEAIQGEWEAVSAEISGVVMDAATIQRLNRRLMIEGNSFREEMLRDGQVVGAQGKFTLSPKTKAFDFFGSEIARADKSLEYVGIYELDGDTLRLCCRANVDGRALRPNGFRSDGEKPNWSHNYVYRKVRK